MEHCLGDLRDEIAMPYLDDVVVFNRTFNEHVDHLRRVLRHLKEHGVKLKPQKCNLFKREVCFLRHIVSKRGYTMDPKGVKAVESLKNTGPTTIGEVRHLVGLLSYYRRYIPNFSRTAKPLYDLLNATNGTKQTNSRNGYLAASTKIQWTDKHQESLEKLIGYLTSQPIMAYPDYSKPYIVHTDTSKDGLGITNLAFVIVQVE